MTNRLSSLHLELQVPFSRAISKYYAALNAESTCSNKHIQISKTRKGRGSKLMRLSRRSRRAVNSWTLKRSLHQGVTLPRARKRRRRLSMRIGRLRKMKRDCRMSLKRSVRWRMLWGLRRRALGQICLVMVLQIPLSNNYIQQAWMMQLLSECREENTKQKHSYFSKKFQPFNQSFHFLKT